MTGWHWHLVERDARPFFDNAGTMDRTGAVYLMAVYTYVPAGLYGWYNLQAAMPSRKYRNGTIALACRCVRFHCLSSTLPILSLAGVHRAEPRLHVRFRLFLAIFIHSRGQIIRGPATRCRIRAVI